MITDISPHMDIFEDSKQDFSKEHSGHHPENRLLPHPISMKLGVDIGGKSSVTSPRPILTGLPPVDRLRSTKQYYAGLMSAGSLVLEIFEFKINEFP